jgi:predicted YcjX-like family ATPase
MMKTNEVETSLHSALTKAERERRIMIKRRYDWSYCGHMTCGDYEAYIANLDRTILDLQQRLSQTEAPR